MTQNPPPVPISKDRKLRSSKEKRRLTHEYFKRKGHYRFMGKGALRLLLGLLALGLLVFLFNRYVIDVNAALQGLFKDLSDREVMGLFFTSECFLGLLPIDVFVAWGSSQSQPVLYIALLGGLSYIGGSISFIEGRLIGRSPRLQAWLLRKYRKQWESFLRFGWLFVTVAAITPIPFAPVSIVAGMLGMSPRIFFLAALSRLARFGLYGLVIYQILN